MTGKINGIFIIAGTLMMAYVMAESGKTLKTPETPQGIINLEFAHNRQRVNEVMMAWTFPGTNNIDNISVAIQNTWFDFIFLFFYSLMLFYACRSISSAYNGILNKSGKLLAMGSLYAGLFDIAENAGMLFSLNGYTSDTIAFFTVCFSAIKWALVLTALSYIIITGPVYLAKLFRRK